MEDATQGGEEVSPYILPLNGSFYVPPQYQRIAGQLPPFAGDFARGQRKVETALNLVLEWDPGLYPVPVGAQDSVSPLGGLDDE